LYLPQMDVSFLLLGIHLVPVAWVLDILLALVDTGLDTLHLEPHSGLHCREEGYH